MKLVISSVLTVLSILGIWVLIPADHPKPTSLWFDEYGSISWQDEQIRLDNFSAFLKDKPNYIGFVAIYQGWRESNRNVEKRIERIKRHLLNDHKIDASRITIVRRDLIKNKTWTILQPIRKDLSPPDFP